MKYMLDTNAIIMAVRHNDWEISKRIKEHVGVDLCISVITYGELEYGIKKSNNPDKNRVAILQNVVVTNNTREFSRVNGLLVEDWSI